MKRQNTTTYQNQLEQHIDEILYYVWDPIDICNSSPESRNEYASYVHDIYNALVSNGSISDLSTLLSNIISNDMEIVGNVEREQFVAKLIWEWSQYLKNKHLT